MGDDCSPIAGGFISYVKLAGQTITMARIWTSAKFWLKVLQAKVCSLIFFKPIYGYCALIEGQESQDCQVSLNS